MRKVIAAIVLIPGAFLFHLQLILQVYTGDFIFAPSGVIIILGIGFLFILIGTTVWGWKEKNHIFTFVFILIGGVLLVLESAVIIYDSVLYVLPKAALLPIYSIDYKELIIGSASLFIASAMVYFGTRMFRHKKGFLSYLTPVLIVLFLSIGILYSSLTRLHISDAYWFTSRNVVQVDTSALFYVRSRYSPDQNIKGMKIPINLLRLKSSAN